MANILSELFQLREKSAAQSGKIAQLEAEIERLQEAISTGLFDSADYLSKMMEMKARAEKAEAERDECVAMLRRLEWSWEDEDGTRFCDSCGKTKREGHAKSCAFAALLARIEGE